MNVLRILYDSIIYSVMIANVGYLTWTYLAYDCDTNSAPYFPVVLMTPRFSLCFELLDVARPDERDMTWLNFNLTETFDEIFSSMPQPSDFIASCSHRNLTLDVMVDVDDGDLCTDLLQVSRFKMQGFLCYRFELFDPPTYSYHTVANSLYQPRELYSVTLRGPMTRLNTFYPILHVTDYPTEDRAFERDRYKTINSMYHLTYSIYETKSLPAPYESRCIDWSMLSCYQLCVDSHLKSYGLVSDGSLVVEGTDEASRKLVPLGHNLEGKLDEIRKNCFKKCSFDACSLKIVTTSISPAYESGGILKFVVEAVDSPVSKIEQIPKLLLADYLTQVCSVISIWIGISFTSIRGIFQKASNYAVFINVRVNLYFQTIHKLLGAHLSKEMTLMSEKPRMRGGEKNKAARAGYFILRCTIIAAVVFLFAWQVFNSTSGYFRYLTTVRFSILINSRASAPVIAICFDYGDSFGFKERPEVTETNYDEYFNQIDDKVDRSIGSLFSELKKKKVLSGCYLRNWKDRMKSLEYHNETQCLKHFKLKPEFISQQFCYEIRPKVLTLPVFQAEIRFLLLKPSVIYTIDLAENFTFNSMTIYSYLLEWFPGWNTEPIVLTNSSRKREVSISTRLFVNHLLPAPYDTDCSEEYQMSRCYLTCLNNSLGNDFIPYCAKEQGMIKSKIFSYTELAQPPLYRKWQQFEDKCEAKCTYDKCQNNFTSAAYSGEWPVTDDTFKISVEPKSAVVNVLRATPVMLLYDLLYQIMCCFSFWLGFSFTGINPLTIAANRHYSRIESYAKMRFIILKRLMKKLIPFHVSKKQPRGNASIFERLSWKQLTNWLVELVAAFACLAHLAYSMQIYLTYSTYIDVAQKTESETDYSSLLCLDIAELFARDEGLDMYNLTNSDRTRLLNRTVTDIFEKTPREDTIIQGCSHWGLTSRRGKVQRMQNLTDRILFYTRNTSTCHEHYLIQRMIVGSLICYQFVPRNFTEWTTMRFRNVLEGYKTYFTITVNSALLTRRFSLLISVNRRPPTSSSEFAPNFFKDPKYNHFHISFTKFESSFLPSPYPNEDFNPFMFDRCLTHCINEALIGHDKVFSARFTDSEVQTNATFVNMIDRQVDGGSKRLQAIIAGCERGCTRYNDRTLTEDLTRVPIFVPAVSASWSSSHMNSDQILLQLQMTRIPVFYITFKLKISFFEQIINLGSIVSIWFGFSAISLAQVRRMRQREITSHDFDKMDERLRILGTIYGMTRSR